MKARYALLATTLIVAAILVFAVRGGEAEEAPDAGGSTLATTWIDPDGDGRLEVGPAEPLVDATDLAQPSSSGTPFATLVQISDAHVRDEESPARAPLLDRLDPVLNSTSRPQEALSPQVLNAAVEATNAAEPDAVIETGDLIDSAQANELDQALGVLDGGMVDPDSGASGYDGLQEISNPDPFIYRPDIDAPRHPGILDAAQEPFEAPGLDAPWFPVLGNHDLLVQGEVPPTRTLDRIATGERQLVALDPDLKPPKGDVRFTPGIVDRYLANGLPGRTEAVPPDPAREHLGENEIVSRLRSASDASASGSLLNYTFDVGDKLRVVVLDVVDREGGSSGLVTQADLDFLQSAVETGDHWLVVATHQPLSGSQGGEDALAILDRSPRVIAAISGHTHQSAIEPRETPLGGYWLISTPSLTDYPQQTRELSFAETDDGVVIETWMLDTAPDDLADTARDLAYLDAGGGRPQSDAGEAADRNVRLFLDR